MQLANKNLSYVKLWQYIVTFDKNSVLVQLKLQFVIHLACYGELRAQTGQYLIS